MIVYLDNSATTKVYNEVSEKMAAVMTEHYGNPSSLHTLGLEAEKLLKEARRSIASVFGADDKEIVFTSGGTESDNTAIKGVWESRKKQGRRVITTAVEHPAVLEAAVTGVPDPQGIRGFLVKATVVLRPGYEGSPELVKELQNFVKKNTAPYKYPRIVEFTDALPKTFSGKIRRTEIRRADAEKYRQGGAKE